MMDHIAFLLPRELDALFNIIASERFPSLPCRKE